jgi:hypothetical protein
LYAWSSTFISGLLRAQVCDFYATVSVVAACHDIALRRGHDWGISPAAALTGTCQGPPIPFAIHLYISQEPQEGFNSSHQLFGHIRFSTRFSNQGLSAHLAWLGASATEDTLAAVSPMFRLLASRLGAGILM